MRGLLIAAMVALLWRSEVAMEAVRASCRLFVTAVMPGLLPYMVFSTMLCSRMRGRSPLLLTVLGWCGGSPTGARLTAMTGGLSPRQRAFVGAATATMSPMFLVGTCGSWLGSRWAGMVLLGSVLAGGAVSGAVASAVAGDGTATAGDVAVAPLPLGAAVEQTARTLLLVCGTMALWRVLATFAALAWPAAELPVMTLLEVTCGAARIAELPLPLPLRTALLAGATGFGGASILAQNRAVAGEKTGVAHQILFQALHGTVSFLLALGLMLLGQT